MLSSQSGLQDASDSHPFLQEGLTSHENDAADVPVSVADAFAVKLLFAVRSRPGLCQCCGSAAAAVLRRRSAAGTAVTSTAPAAQPGKRPGCARSAQATAANPASPHVPG